MLRTRAERSETIATGGVIGRSMAAFAFPLLLVFTFAQDVQVPTQTAPCPRVTIMFGEGVPYNTVWVGYGLFGPKGGHRYFGVPRASGAAFYEIKAAGDGKAVDRLKRPGRSAPTRLLLKCHAASLKVGSTMRHHALSSHSGM